MRVFCIAFTAKLLARALTPQDHGLNLKSTDIV